MNQDNNTFVQNNPNVTVGNSVLPSAPTVSAQTTVPLVQQTPPTETATTQPARNPDVLVCSKCGSDMKKESRYCMKCGNLNYLHPDNESMKQYAWQNIKQGHFISGANLDNNQPLSMNSSKSISNAHPYRACLITNIILHILPVIGVCILFYVTYSKVGLNVPIGTLIVFAITMGISFLFNYSMQAIYIKADEPWWGYYVPFYNNYLLFKIAMGNGLLFLTLIVPIVGFVFFLIVLYNLGKKFYKSGLLTMFFPCIMIPIIALDKNTEYSVLAKTTRVETPVVTNGKTDSEKAYGRKKFLITLLVVVIFAVILCFAWPYLAPIVEKVYNLIMEKI